VVSSANGGKIGILASQTDKGLILNKKRPLTGLEPGAGKRIELRICYI
jgi:hypothetical protein